MIVYLTKKTYLFIKEVSKRKLFDSVTY